MSNSRAKGVCLFCEELVLVKCAVILGDYVLPVFCSIVWTMVL